MTGSVDMLDDILGRIRHAVSDEVVKIIVINIFMSRHECGRDI